MDDLLIPGIVGNERISVRVTFPHGSAGVAHIYIDSSFQGQATLQANGWHVYLNGKSILSPEDSEIIIKAINDYVPGNDH